MDENQKQNSPNTNIKTIHTYASDMTEAIRDNEASVIKIALAEKDKRERDEIYKNAKGTPLSRTVLTIGGIVLIFVAIGISYFLFKKNNNISSAPTNIVTEVSTIVPYDEKVDVDVTNISSQFDFSDIIKKEVANTTKAGTIKVILPEQNIAGVTQYVSLSDFLGIMKTSMPDSLERNLGDAYMIGSYTDTSDSRAHLFLVFAVKDYNQAYASMLSWEKTMLNDLFALFRVDVSGDRSALFEKSWADILVDNKDARILYDNLGNDILYYIFPDKNTLIITDNQETIKELTARLLVKNTKPV